MWHDRSLVKRLSSNSKDTQKSKVQNEKGQQEQPWSDSESSESESDEKRTTNVCLMAKEVQNNKETDYENSDEVDASELYKYSKEELIDTLISFANIEQKYLSKYKDLKKNILELTQKKLSFGETK